MHTWHLPVEDLRIPSPWPSFFDILFSSVRRGSFPIPLTTRCEPNNKYTVKVLLCAFSESVVRWSRKGKYWVKEIACKVVFAFETVFPLQKEKFQDHNCSNLQQWNVAILQVWPTGLRRSPRSGHLHSQQGAMSMNKGEPKSDFSERLFLNWKTETNVYFTSLNLHATC